MPETFPPVPPSSTRPGTSPGRADVHERRAAAGAGIPCQLLLHPFYDCITKPQHRALLPPHVRTDGSRWNRVRPGIADMPAGTALPCAQPFPRAAFQTGHLAPDNQAAPASPVRTLPATNGGMCLRLLLQKKRNAFQFFRQFCGGLDFRLHTSFHSPYGRGCRSWRYSR